ncbi:hypothetical protein ACFL0D_00860 [Thermoproteota archaeon]
MSKRVMVTLDEEQYAILQGIKGLGKKDAEKIRNIIIAYFSEKNYIQNASNNDPMKDIPEYSYVRYTWTREINVEKEAEKLSKEFEIIYVNTSEPGIHEIAIHKATRKEIIIKADTVRAIISAYRAVLYQKQKAPFTKLDLLLRQKILELYPRTTHSPFPIGFSFEPRFITENQDNDKSQ